MPTRFEREIDEIVSKADLPKPVRIRRFRWPPTLVRLGPRLSRFAAPGIILLAGVILLIVGLLSGSGPLAFGGIGLMLAAYLFSIWRGGRSFHETTGYDRSWRGRALDQTDRPSWFKRKK